MGFVALLIIMVVSIVVATSLAPKTEPPKPASLEDFKLPTAEPGRSIPVVFGTVMVTGPNVVWYGDLYAARIRSKGGK